MQVAVLVLAALGFTLWGAVLVDVGTALVVILYGMLLMRWRLPGHKRGTVTGQANVCQAGVPANKPPCIATSSTAHWDDHATHTSPSNLACCTQDQLKVEHVQKCNRPSRGCSREACCSKP